MPFASSPHISSDTFNASSNFISSNSADGSPALGDLWLPVFSGEILTRYLEYLTLADKVRSATIPEGTTAHFPALGKMESEIHGRGTEMIGMPSEQTQRTLTLEDRPVVSHFELDDIEKMLTYYESRMELASECGRALARQWDAKVAMLIAMAATDPGGDGTTASASWPGGTSITNAASATANEAGALAILACIEEQVVTFDDTYVPLEDRFCAVTSGMWYALKNLGVPSALTGGTVSDSKAYFGDTRFAHTAGGINPASATGASTAGSDFLIHNGVKIVRSINIPTADYSADTTVDAKYRQDFSNTTALIWQKQAVGAVTKMGVATETYRDVRRQSDFFVSKVFTGGGTLRPQNACLVKSSA